MRRLLLLATIALLVWALLRYAVAMEPLPAYVLRDTLLLLLAAVGVAAWAAHRYAPPRSREYAWSGPGRALFGAGALTAVAGALLAGAAADAHRPGGAIRTACLADWDRAGAGRRALARPGAALCAARCALGARRRRAHCGQAHCRGQWGRQWDGQWGGQWGGRAGQGRLVRASADTVRSRGAADLAGAGCAGLLPGQRVRSAGSRSDRRAAHHALAAAAGGMAHAAAAPATG